MTAGDNAEPFDCLLNYIEFLNVVQMSTKNAPCKTFTGCKSTVTVSEALTVKWRWFEALEPRPAAGGIPSSALLIHSLCVLSSGWLGP